MPTYPLVRAPAGALATSKPPFLLQRTPAFGEGNWETAVLREVQCVKLGRRPMHTARPDACTLFVQPSLMKEWLRFAHGFRQAAPEGLAWENAFAGLDIPAILPPMHSHHLPTGRPNI